MDNQIFHKPYEHILSKYLGRISISLEALRISGDPLLRLDFFCQPLFELLYAGIVAGLEKYIEDRLTKEALFSEESAVLYVKKYNSSLIGRKQRFKIELNSPLSDDDKQDIVDSISHQVFHRINDMSGHLQTSVA